MAIKKQHQDRSPCPLASALDVVGDHWTLLVIRDLMFMSRHEFKDMLNAWEGISTNILTNRLEKLTSNNIINSIPHPESKRRKLYYLTDKGKSLFPIIAELTIWGFQQKKPNPTPPHLKDLLSGDRKKVEKQLHIKLNKWEKTYL
ncbi:MAG: winged helix-turn-helix transcriptional regulator [Akkermansiaceae bacterium]